MSATDVKRCRKALVDFVRKAINDAQSGGRLSRTLIARAERLADDIDMLLSDIEDIDMILSKRAAARARGAEQEGEQ